MHNIKINNTCSDIYILCECLFVGDSLVVTIYMGLGVSCFRQDAHIALEEVREIQYNLGEAERLQAEISGRREDADMSNRTYWAEIQKVFSVCKAYVVSVCLKHEEG